MKGEDKAAPIATGMGIVPGSGIQFGKERPVLLDDFNLRGRTADLCAPTGQPAALQSG